MNTLTYVINEIKQRIPFELLHAGLTLDETQETVNLTSLEDKLLRKVIRSRVMVDANIVGGIEMLIPLSGVHPSYYEDNYTVYNIPPELTNNREIISALSMMPMPISGHGGGRFTGTIGATRGGGGFGSTSQAVNGVADRIGNSASSSAPIGHTHIELVAYNTIVVYAHYTQISTMGLRVLLENDNNLNNIQPRSYNNLAMLSMLATKAYLYNKLIIPINSGYLSGGQDLGVFKSLLEDFNGAEEEYQIYLREVWSPVAYMNDTTRHNRFISSMLAPDL